VIHCNQVRLGHYIGYILILARAYSTRIAFRHFGDSHTLLEQSERGWQLGRYFPRDEGFISNVSPPESGATSQ
jgi:hypothetical protein